jgi:hypothetical protein
MASQGEDALLDRLQRETLRYFWDFAHPVSGLARERSNRSSWYGPEVVTTGGSGFGIMALIAGVERGWLRRRDVARRILGMLDFLSEADSFHGVFPHFLNGESGKVVPFSRKDDGADLVETSFLMMGLLCARQYFDREERTERLLRSVADRLFRSVEWTWHTRGENVLYWHWSPTFEWDMRHQIRGWNECLITYVLAASSSGHPIDPSVYHEGFATSPVFRNGNVYYEVALPLGPAYSMGGPLFFAHYSFLGLDPRHLEDDYANYWEQNRAHVLVNRAYCIDNPHGFAGYGADCWGLTASDTEGGYTAHSPNNDRGVISPTAALSSFPYAPKLCRQALERFADMPQIWGEYGPKDAFSLHSGWVADSHLAIDQGPIVVMVENYRSGLLWRLFMSCPEVQAGLRRLGFRSPRLTS